MARVKAQVAEQRDRLFYWAPVCLGAGVGLYFGVRFEPSVLLLSLALGSAVVLGFACRLGPEVARIILLMLALVAGGFGLAGLRAHWVAEPVLGFRYYGPIEGRIVHIDRSQSDAVRLTLDRVVLSRMDPRRTPARVRISLHGTQDVFTPEPGQVVLMTGHLSPPSGPVEPGGFDFQRMAWFQGLGGVGYTRTPVVLGAPAQEGQAGLWIYRQRVAISRGVQDRIDGEAGAFAAAIMTGDRSGMGQDSLAALRASNLAHLLAISGMHMGILAAFIFGLVRYGLSLWSGLALRVPVKKVAAVTALVVAAGYLALSGGNVATQRAFIMVAVMLVAVLFDRRALTLRAVAIAALIVLVLRPEALYGPGFQMSFAATAALVAVFGSIRYTNRHRAPRWLQFVGGVALSSFVAGLATAPIAAFHFNQIAHYGLIANVLSVPLMGTVVMPAAVLAAVLAPVGLEGIGLWLMEQGLRWILGVAHFIAGLDGALRHVVTPPVEVLVLIALGGLFVIVWRGSLRWAGSVPLLLGLLLWQMAARPDVLIADSGSLIGVMGPEGRDVSKERGESFAAGSWLENDGAPVAQAQAYARAVLREDGRVVEATLAGVQLVNVRGATALAGLQGCGGADILITNQEAPAGAECEVFDINRLRQTGAVAGWIEDGGLRLETARDRSGDRLWNAEAVRRQSKRLPPVLAFLQ